jgi:tetratricopeptide (TPR) repeat protein
MREWKNGSRKFFLAPPHTKVWGYSVGLSVFLSFCLSSFLAFSLPISDEAGKTHIELGKMSLNMRDLETARVHFQAALEEDSQNAEAHYFLGVIEYENGNIEAAKARFQLAHEVVSNFKQNVQKAELQFPDGYNVRVYYKDGWYLQSKKAPILSEAATYSFQTGSTYKVSIKKSKPGKLSFYAKLLVGLTMLSWLAAR